MPIPRASLGRALRAILSIAAGLSLAGCGNGSGGPGAAARPVPIGDRFYRGTLDGRAVLFFEASASALTLAYDTALCGLYAAWRGPAVGDSANADGSYAVQGPLYRRQTAPRLWTVRNGRDTLAAAARFLGFSGDGTGFARFRYAIPLPAGDSILVAEEPSFDDHYGDDALRRDFRFEGIPPGDTVRLDLGGERGSWPEKWELSAGGNLTGTPGAPALEMALDGIASTKVRWEGSSAP